MNDTVKTLKTKVFLRIAICAALGAFLFYGAHGDAYAESARERASAVNADLKSRTAQQQRLEGESRQIGLDLEESRERLVAVARDVQDNQARLFDLEARIGALGAEEAALEEKLKTGRKSAAATLMALERMRRNPPATMLLSPDAPLRTAQTAMLLKEVLPPLQARAARIREDMITLTGIRENLLSQRQQHAATATKLLAEQKSLQALLTRKEDIYRQTRKDLEEERKQVRALAAKSQNLADLIEKMDRRPNNPPPKTDRAAARNLPDIGAAKWPLRGRIRTQFQEPDHLGSPSMGISIEGRPGALVIAPLPGIVRFAGAFKNYGNLVILEHKNGYHSLVAGLGKINTGVGHAISAGEPIGELRRGESSETPALYYELRYNGKAINPALKLAALDS